MDESGGSRRREPQTSSFYQATGWGGPPKEVILGILAFLIFILMLLASLYIVNLQNQKNQPIPQGNNVVLQ